ncbi:MAG: hypothetical protein FJZ80_02295 [Bacteroidetes bacterium]|nr:hypothetical protein [Bacteroidota bacterium]
MRVLLFVGILFTFHLNAQVARFDNLRKIQTGPYFGLQQGRNVVIELGMERISKEIKWKSPNAFGLNAGVNFDYRARVLGGEIGSWFRPGRMSFTLGGAIAVRSDFNDVMIGLAPMLGYKIWMFHAFVGYYFYPTPLPNAQTNQLFVSLRIMLTQQSKWKNK